MTDFPSAGEPEPASLTRRVWREVVVVHEPLGCDRRQIVETLRVRCGCQSQNTQDLCLAALENARTVDSR